MTAIVAMQNDVRASPEKARDPMATVQREAKIREATGFGLVVSIQVGVTGRLLNFFPAL
jgi:hypothetical protein